METQLMSKRPWMDRQGEADYEDGFGDGKIKGFISGLGWGLLCSVIATLAMGAGWVWDQTHP